MSRRREERGERREARGEARRGKARQGKVGSQNKSDCQSGQSQVRSVQIRECVRACLNSAECSSEARKSASDLFPLSGLVWSGLACPSACLPACLPACQSGCWLGFSREQLPLPMPLRDGPERAHVGSTAAAAARQPVGLGLFGPPHRVHPSLSLWIFRNGRDERRVD